VVQGVLQVSNIIVDAGLIEMPVRTFPTLFLQNIGGNKGTGFPPI
jgi:hypothetical protein